jgi:hypothetical protein
VPLLTAAVLAGATGSDWNAGGSIMTFYFPIGLFLIVATVLLLLFSRPHSVPGRRPLRLVRAAASGAAQAAPGADGASPAPEPEPPASAT